MRRLKIKNLPKYKIWLKKRQRCKKHRKKSLIKLLSRTKRRKTKKNSLFTNKNKGIKQLNNLMKP